MSHLICRHLLAIPMISSSNLVFFICERKSNDFKNLSCLIDLDEREKPEPTLFYYKYVV